MGLIEAGVVNVLTLCCSIVAFLVPAWSSFDHLEFVAARGVFGGYTMLSMPRDFNEKTERKVRDIMARRDGVEGSHEMFLVQLAAFLTIVSSVLAVVFSARGARRRAQIAAMLTALTSTVAWFSFLMSPEYRTFLEECQMRGPDCTRTALELTTSNRIERPVWISFFFAVAVSALALISARLGGMPDNECVYLAVSMLISKDYKFAKRYHRSSRFDKHYRLKRRPRLDYKEVPYGYDANETSSSYFSRRARSYKPTSYYSSKAYGSSGSKSGAYYHARYPYKSSRSFRRSKNHDEYYYGHSGYAR